MNKLRCIALVGLMSFATYAHCETLVTTSSPVVTVSKTASFSLSDPPPYDLVSAASFPFSSLYFNPTLGTLNSVTAHFDITVPVFANGNSQSVFASGETVSVTLNGSAAAQVRLIGTELASDTVSYTGSCTAVGDGDGIGDFCTIGDGTDVGSTPAAEITINHTQIFTGGELAPFLINDSLSRLFVDVEFDAVAAGDVSSALVWARTFGIPGAQALLTLTYDYTPGGADADGDGLADSSDNCTLVANPDQYDANGDGIGNICDADLTGPGGVEDCIVNFVDLQAFKIAFFSTPGSPAWNPTADVDGSGAVNFADLQVPVSQLFGPPGPSATGCN